MPKSFKGRVVLPKEDARDGWHSRGYFPHFDGQGVTQHVSFHLFDSLPQSVLARWRDELRMRPQKEAELERRKRIQNFLDSGVRNLKTGCGVAPEGSHAFGVLML